MFASWNSNSKSDMARKPADDDAAALLPGEVDRESRVAEHRDVLEVGEHALCEVDALLEREERGLPRIRGNADHDAVEDDRRPPHEVLVAVRDRVERAGIDGAPLQVHVLVSS